MGRSPYLFFDLRFIACQKAQYSSMSRRKYQIERCFEVGRGMKHSKVRDREGGEKDALSQVGGRSAYQNRTPPTSSAGIAGQKIVQLLLFQYTINIKILEASNRSKL